MRIRGFYRLIMMGFIGGIIGFFVAIESNPLPLRPRNEIQPRAYRVSKIPGGTPLRLAMVHDVLHERYLRHGNAWYAKRNDDAGKIIADYEKANSQSSPPPQYLDALDDLAVGLEHIGQFPEAIAIARKKLLLVSPLPATRPVSNSTNYQNFLDLDQRDLYKIIAAQNISSLQHHQYTACANLGTILIIDALHKLFSGNTGRALKSEMQESLGNIEQAIAINPAGHFGREAWQAILIEHLLAALDHPDLLQKYDMIGESLDSNQVEGIGEKLAYLGPHPDFLHPNLTADQRTEIRMNIYRVGIDTDWAAVVNPDYPMAMPFDEPTLAIIGMWTIGGGPNPHFALALGRIMQNIDQYYIAWNAYQRAIELAAGFWPDEKIRQSFIATCRARQDEIAQSESLSNPSAWQDQMRAQHKNELAWGMDQQKAYEDYEAKQISVGIPLSDSHFYDAYFKDHPSIASSPGLSDDLIVTHTAPAKSIDILPCLLIGIGAGMVLSLIIPEKILS